MTLLSEIYDVTLKKDYRGKAAEGWIRPTVAQFFTCNKPFYEVASIRPPGVPTITNVVAGNLQATVHFTAPEDNGGSEITSYTAVSNPGGIQASVSQSESGSITVYGLAGGGQEYTFDVYATNIAGNSENSNTSNSIFCIRDPFINMNWVWGSIVITYATKITSTSLSRIYTPPTNPIAPGKWTWCMDSQDSARVNQFPGVCRVPSNLPPTTNLAYYPQDRLPSVPINTTAYFAIEFDGSVGWIRAWQQGSSFNSPDLDIERTLNEGEVFVVSRECGTSSTMKSWFHWYSSAPYIPSGYTNGLKFLS